jgi:hypothetical protein
MTQFPSAFPAIWLTLEKQFFDFWAKLHNHNFSPIFAYKESTKPVIGLFRVLREGHWPKFFATFRQYTCPTLGLCRGERAALWGHEASFAHNVTLSISGTLYIRKASCQSITPTAILFDETKKEVLFTKRAEGTYRVVSSYRMRA